MSAFLISFILASGAGAFAYSKLGKRVGYGNSAGVWQLVGILFVITFIIVFILLKYVIVI